MNNFNNILKTVANNFSGKNEKEIHIESTIEPLQEVEDAINHIEPQQSEFTLCAQKIASLINNKTEPLENILPLLDELNSIHNKRINGFKHILQTQKDFHKNGNGLIKEKNKQKTELVKAQQEEIKNLKDSLQVFEKLQAKYMDATNKIIELNLIIGNGNKK